MKKYINKLFLLGSLLFLGASCENEAAQVTTLKTVNFSNKIEVSAATLVLTEDMADNTVELISWPAVTFPVGTPVTYAIQFDLMNVVSGPTAWQKAKRIEVGEDVLSKSFTVAELNKIAVDLGLPTDVAGNLAVRVEAVLDHKIYSDFVPITVTPYKKTLVIGEMFMPGSYQGWDVNTAAVLKEIQIKVYQGYMSVPVGAGLEFKLNPEKNWEVFYGAGASNSELEKKSDKDFLLPGAGSYQVKVNLNTLKWTATSYSWGIVGPSQPGGWDNSTPMSYDHQNKTWKITTSLVPGALKFRLNNSWTINYGPADPSKNTINLDNGGAYEIGEAGTYEVTFKIEETDPASDGYPATATCTIVKK